MKFINNNQLPTIKGPETWFTGEVLIDGIRNPDEQSSVGAAHVRLTPGVRIAWHKHPKGQSIYITDGVGYACRRGDSIEEVHAGDSIYF